MSNFLHRVVGIDLGTTFSAVATYNKNKDQPQIIANKAEKNTTMIPSVVSLHTTSHKAIVGWSAKRNLLNDPQNTITEIKRKMGEKFNSWDLENFFSQTEFKVGDPVKVYFAGSWRLPQEISALILMKIKELAEAEIGDEIHDAVIAVPAWFHDRSRSATREAALLAGLYLDRLINEPAAAAIGYGVHKTTDRKVYLVYDLGGATFDVSIIKCEEGSIEIIATSGDPRIGGGDFDERITEWAIAQLKQQFNIDVSSDPFARARIKFQAEQAKIQLSTHASTTLELTDIFPKQLCSLALTRDNFDEMVENLLSKTITIVHWALDSLEKRDVGIYCNDIDGILLVGGSSKIPKVKMMLLDHFGKDEAFVMSDPNPDEVVARGAAIYASLFEPSPSPFSITEDMNAIREYLSQIYAK